MLVYPSCLHKTAKNMNTRICCSSVLCCVWLNSLRDAYAGRTKVFHWTPALKKKLTGRCSTAKDQSGCTIEPTLTVSVVFIGLVCMNMCTNSTMCVRSSLPSPPEGPGGGRAGFWRLLLHTAQPQHLQPVGHLLSDRALR